MIDQGRIGSSTTVGEMVDEHLAFVNEGATILQLLTHTSGIVDDLDEALEQDSECLSLTGADGGVGCACSITPGSCAWRLRQPAGVRSVAPR